MAAHPSGGIQTKIIDISIPAIKDAMEAKKITNEGDCMDKVVVTFRHFLNKQGDE